MAMPQLRSPAKGSVPAVAVLPHVSVEKGVPSHGLTVGAAEQIYAEIVEESIAFGMSHSAGRRFFYLAGDPRAGLYGIGII